MATSMERRIKAAPAASARSSSSQRAAIQTVLHSFAGGTGDGANPYDALIQGSDGKLYGTTSAGGSSGYGMVFAITSSGTETVLHAFAGGSGERAQLSAGLIQGSDGNRYGAAVAWWWLPATARSLNIICSIDRTRQQRVWPATWIVLMWCGWKFCCSAADGKR